LEAAGCERTFSELASVGAAEGPVLADLLTRTPKGDTLVVWRLDRLGRSLPHLTKTVQKLGVVLKSLTEGIDAAPPNGWLIFQLFGALAQFERELIRERTAAGLFVARAQGCKGGRPQKLGAEKLWLLSDC